MKDLLTIENLVVEFNTPAGVVQAVNGISYSVAEGEIVAIVGESGSGKSVSARAVLGLVPDPPGKIVSGSIWFDSVDLLGLDDQSIRDLRGQRYIDGFSGTHDFAQSGSFHWSSAHRSHAASFGSIPFCCR